MSLPEGLAEVLAKSNEAIAQTLAGALQNLKYQRAPSVKLRKFRGPPLTQGDPTLREWLRDLDVYIRQLGLTESEAVDVALDHLGGEARGEVLCCPAGERVSVEKIAALLSRRFVTESVQSLQATFYGRLQEDGESLAEYSRSLMSLYGRVEQAATTSSEESALASLREDALREQLVKGVRDVSIRRELRRLALDHRKVSFYEFRELALALLADTEEVDDVELRHVRDRGGKGTSPIPDKSKSSDNKTLTDLVEGQSKLQSAMEQLVIQQAQMTTQLEKVASSLSVMAEKSARSSLSCKYCHKPGHTIEKCYKRKREQAKGDTSQEAPNPMAGNGVPPS